MTEPKLCECGCGEVTKINPVNNASRGLVKGEYNRFVVGHSRRNPIARDACAETPANPLDAQTIETREEVIDGRTFTVRVLKPAASKAAMEDRLFRSGRRD